MRSKRTDKLAAELASLESEFREKLVSALRLCAKGYWGLFCQNDHVDLGHLRQELLEQSGAAELISLSEEIDTLRSRLGIAEPFALARRFVEQRGRSHANALGEARLAQAWLEEMGEPLEPHEG